MGYGTLEHMFWEDADLQELALENRAVAAYLLTCRHSTSFGYYRLAIGYVCEDLRIDRTTALGYLGALDLKNFARYDEASQVVFIRNAMRWKPPRGKKSIEGAVKRAVEVPMMNPFRSLFFDAATQWAPEFAAALAVTGWASTTPRHDTPSLFEQPGALAQPLTISPAPIEPVSDPPADAVDAVLRHAASLSVQQSLARGEGIRNPEAVARSRLASNHPTWRSLVERWMHTFEGVSHIDMAKALVDGGHASPYWKRAPVAT